jgi:hypothetical protein
MQLFSYLYIVVGLIPYQQIKVMKLKAYLQLQKSEIQSLFPIDSLSNIEIPNLLDTSIIIAGTGTTGDTTILTSGIHTIIGTNLDIGTTMIGGIVIITIFLGHMLDRKLNRNLDQELHQKYYQSPKGKELE